jgi:hypothetical protein
MAGSDFLNMLFLGSIPIAGWLHVLTIPHIFVVAVLAASAFVWFDAANFGALPTLVGRERIVVASSAVVSMSTIAGIIGPAIGGELAATIGPASAISFDAVSYLLSAVSLMLIPRVLSTLGSAKPAARAFVPQTFAGIREGISFIWHHQLVRVLTLTGFGLSLTGGAVNGLLVVYAVQALHLLSSDSRIGLLFTSGAIGSLVASLILPWTARRVPAGWITLGAMSLNVIILIILAGVSSLITALFLFVCWQMAYTLTTTNGIALRQLVVPKQLQSRVNVYARMVAWGGTPFGAALGGILAQITTVRVAYFLMAAGVALSAIMGWFSPLRAQTKASDLAQSSVPDDI